MGLFGPKGAEIGTYRTTFVYQGPFKEDSSTGSRVINEVVLEVEFCELRLNRTLRRSCTKTRIAPVSSVTDHRRLMYVAILRQLSKQEVRDVLPRNSGGIVRISAEKDLVLTRGTLVSDPGWAHDHPL